MKPSLLGLAHYFVQQVLRQGDLAVDATVGNGHDTVFLARQVGPSGQVFAFDIQRAAVESARALAEKEKVGDRITFFQCGHEQMAARLCGHGGHVRAIMFNLGYLPGGDKGRITRPESTVPALAGAFDLLAPRGRITVVAYPGHPGGAAEAAAVRTWTRSFSTDKAETFGCELLTPLRPAPFLAVVEKK